MNLTGMGVDIDKMVMTRIHTVIDKMGENTYEAEQEIGQLLKVAKKFRVAADAFTSAFGFNVGGAEILRKNMLAPPHVFRVSQLDPGYDGEDK